MEKVKQLNIRMPLPLWLAMAKESLNTGKSRQQWILDAINARIVECDKLKK